LNKVDAATTISSFIWMQRVLFHHCKKNAKALVVKMKDSKAKTFATTVNSPSLV
jgi:hypothetical protein